MPGPALIVDANQLAQTIWHTDAGRLLMTKDKRPSGVAHGFLVSLCSMWDKLKPTDLYVVWDRRSRHRTLLAHKLKEKSDTPEYKEDRRDPAGYDEYRTVLKPQMEALARVLPHVGFRSFIVDGLEGDDLVGILADSLLAAGYRSIIASTDKDFYQLLCDGVEIYNPKTKRMYTASDFRTNFKLEPEEWPEVRALVGDDGDSIPGVPKIGEKTALKLIQAAGLQQWLEWDLEKQPVEKVLVKHVKAIQDLCEQVKTAYELSYILSSVDQIDSDQRIAFTEQWTAVPRADIDEVRRFIDFYELLSAGAKLMDLMTGTAMKSVQSIPELWERWGNCMRCPLHKHRHQIVYSAGPNNARVAFLGEGPGGGEDFQGIPFVGLAGQYLDTLFSFAGITRALVRIMNAVMCVPRDGMDLGTPTAGEIASCRPRVQAELRLVMPRLCVILGGSALKAVFPDAGGITEERGVIKEHPDFPGIKFFPTFHPSYLMRLPQGHTGPHGLYGAHSDIVKARGDWRTIGKMVLEELAA